MYMWIIVAEERRHTQNHDLNAAICVQRQRLAIAASLLLFSLAHIGVLYIVGMHRAALEYNRRVKQSFCTFGQQLDDQNLTD